LITFPLVYARLIIISFNVAKYWNEMDGFSTISPLLFYLSGASSQHLVGHSNIGVSVSNITTTIIINAKTGALVAHWAELDAVDSNNPSIIIQPATPLDYGTYVLRTKLCSYIELTFFIRTVATLLALDELQLRMERLSQR
jgi:hypothetical protein